MEKIKTNLDMVIKNSMLVESPTMVHTDVESGDTFTGELVGRIYQNTIVNQVCDVQPCIGPTGVVYSVKRGPNGELGTQKRVFDLDSKDTIGRFTKEWYQDYTSQFGKDGKQLLTKNLSFDAKDEIDSEFITKLNAIATPEGSAVTFGSTGIISDELMLLLGVVNKMSSKIATDTKRGYNPFVICSPKVGAAFSTLGMTSMNDSFDVQNRDYIGNIGKIRFYIDINATSEYMTVGHNGNGLGDSSLILAPYLVEVLESDDYSTEESAIRIINRYGIVQNPFDTSTGNSDSPFARTIEVDFTNIPNFS